jgi:4-aminobutyrate aminotransferase-like enzyme
MSEYSFSRTAKDVPKVRTEYRVIKTRIPSPGTEEILGLLDRYESRSMHGQLPIVWDRATDFSVYDKAGNKWIDFTSTIFVTNIGHANPHLKARLQKLIDHDLIHTYAYVSEIRAEYLKKLIEFTPDQFEKAFLLSAGTEATEAALKLMRLNGLKQGKRRLGVICIEGNWHGRTMGAQMMGGSAKQREWIGYPDPNIHHIPFPYPWALNGRSGREFLMAGLEKLRKGGIDLQEDVCGFMLETFQGWGCVFYPPDFVQEIKHLCEADSLLLAFDEMQAGFARTGRLFGYEHYGVEPDLICCGKGMSSGLPLSAVLGRAEVMDLPEVGDMSSTHSANPLSCAAGLANIEFIESHNLVNEADRKGKIFHELLQEIKERHPDRISFVLGRGMIAGVLFRNPLDGQPDSLFATKVSERAMQKGLLVVHTGRESIKLAPPLTIPDEAIKEGLSVLDESIVEIAQEESS